MKMFPSVILVSCLSLAACGRGDGHHDGDDHGGQRAPGASSLGAPTHDKEKSLDQGRISTPAAQSSRAGDTVALKIALVRPDDDDTYAFSATGLPPGLAIDPRTGVISGTVAAGASGTYAVEILAREEGGDDDLSIAGFGWSVAG